jgi:DNA replication protein DnaC
LGDRETATLHCIKHGQYQSSRIYFVSDWGNWSACPGCAEEERKRAEQEAELKAHAEAERQRKRQEALDRLDLESRLKASRIPERFADKTLEGYQPDQQSSAAYATCLQYAENFLEYRRKGACLIFCGNTGTGKSHLACAIAGYVMREKKASVVYSTVTGCIRRVKDTYSKVATEKESEAMQKFIAPDLLVLDEVGVQFGSETEKMILFEILNERYNAMKPTILISNLSLENLREFVGDRILDRMRENGGRLLKFEWSSHRATKEAV